MQRFNEENNFEGPTITPDGANMLIGTGLFANDTKHKKDMKFSEIIALGNEVVLGSNLCGMSDPNVPVNMRLCLKIE